MRSSASGVARAGANSSTFSASASPDRRPPRGRRTGASHHVLDDPTEVDVGDRSVGHAAPVSQNRNAVPDLHQLLKAVGDVDHCDALFYQVANHAEERRPPRLRSAPMWARPSSGSGHRGRGAGNLHDLLEAERQPPDQRAGIDGVLQPGEGLGDALLLTPRSRPTPWRVRARAMKTLSVTLRSGNRLSS